MLANANVKVLEDEEDEDVETEVDLEANRQKRIKKKTENDTLTSEQMNQVALHTTHRLGLISTLCVTTLRGHCCQ